MNAPPMLWSWITRDEDPPITLRTPLGWRSSFRFPLQSALARHEVLRGAWLLLLLPGVGWLLNMGHRIEMVHRMHHGRSPWPAWQSPRKLLRHGFVTFLGMVYYLAPGAALCWCGERGVGVGLLVAAVLAIPGYMTHYCRAFDAREIFNPVLALSRALQGGWPYWRAWSIALSALALSFLGLLLGLGFLVTSVWFWQVAGFSFASVFTHHYGLCDGADGPMASLTTSC